MNKDIDKILKLCENQKLIIKEFNLLSHKKYNKIIYFKTIQNRKTLVFVHGFNANKYFPFMELFVKLLKEGYSIITFDLPGHGENKNNFSIKKSDEFSSRVISFLKRKININESEIILVGHSMGGFLALLQAFKKSFAGVITISAPHEINPSPLSFLERFSLINLNTLRQLKYYSFKFFLPFKKRIHSFRNPSKKEVKKFIQEAVSYNFLNKLNQTKIPFLQIHGRLDLIVPFVQAKKIQENYGGSNQTQFFPFTSTHLNIIFQRRTIKEVLKWLKIQKF